MSFGDLIKRGFRLAKAGKALRDTRSDDEAKRNRASHYLVTLLGEGRGLSAKVGQLMTMDSQDTALRETLNTAMFPMPFGEVEALLQGAYGKPYGSVFKSLEEKSITASLGQVHFGVLKDKREVAVKVQYTDIARSVEAELRLLGFLPKVGPVAKWGFNLEGYRDIFWNKFSEELDYGHEIRSQQRYRQLAAPLADVVVPEVVTDLCQPTILVQAREEGFSLDKVESMSQSHRQTAGRVLLRHYLHMIFRCGFVHSDPHPGNFAIRFNNDGQAVLIVYDYGSILEIPDEVRLALLRTILALREHEELDPAACLAGLGFDVEKLRDLRPTLPALLQVLFDPFITEAPYNVKDWRMGERFDNIVGELKWWFRSAAPPTLIFLMRTLQGLVAMIKRLDAKLPWAFILDQLCSDIYPQATMHTLPTVPPAVGPAVGFNKVAKYLKIDVKKPNGNKVWLTMPARVADDLEDIIDPPVKESIARQGVDLKKIQKQVCRSGFVPQVLFEVDDPERQVRVWLE